MYHSSVEKKGTSFIGPVFPPCARPGTLDKWSLDLTQGNSLGQSSLTSDGYEDLGLSPISGPRQSPSPLDQLLIHSRVPILLAHDIQKPTHVLWTWLGCSLTIPKSVGLNPFLIIGTWPSLILSGFLAPFGFSWVKASIGEDGGSVFGSSLENSIGKVSSISSELWVGKYARVIVDGSFSE